MSLAATRFTLLIAAVLLGTVVAPSAAVELPGPTMLVTNVTQNTLHATLQEALDNALQFDEIEIAAGTLHEDDIVFPDGLDVTITGAGMDQTFIDGGGGPGANAILNLIATGQTRDTVISDLTLQNGLNDGQFGGGGVKLAAVHARFHRVRFLANSAGVETLDTAAHVDMIGGSTVFDRCLFMGGQEAGHAISLFTAGDVRLLNCLFAENLTGSVISIPGTSGSAVNCTIVAAGPLAVRDGTGNFQIINTVIVGETQDATYRHSLFAGAPASNGNIDGTPTFVDPMNGDYRLATGSLGIDAADQIAYSAGGGGLIDLNGHDRAVDDDLAIDVGVGDLPFLDMGAYERQPMGASSCPADLDGSGGVDFGDLISLLSAWGPCL